ncbi:hypothetical protein [Marimonas arenosa]|uniref:Uncharacterized protein n=1 Tax=Marimonas arenosa TaxID=1795305 RepID=A0AAE4B548_9RHOB|nr:hypothetical protein [Marimonas arenosa]MDQ2090890.1 hypothetical protein [Marimonas arenosa]
MTIAQGLDDLRANHPGCRLAAFGDLGTRLILRTSTDETHPQEFLDLICVQAAQNFSLSDKVRPADADPETAGREVVVMTSRDVRVIVRSTDNPSDFVCCICETGTSVEDVAVDAAAVLHKLAVGS